MTDTLNQTRKGPTKGRLPPSNLDAEQALLGAMLLARQAIDSAALAVTADDFYKPAHGHVYQAIMDLHARAQAVDPVTVADELARQGLGEVTGGLPALLSLQADTPATSSAGRYARIVADKATLRRLIATAGDIAEMGYADSNDVDLVVDEAEQRILEIATGRSDDENTVDVAEVFGAHLAYLADIYEHGTPPGIVTGWHDLDDRLSPLQPGNCVIVGARPSVGKTAFALNLATNVALEQDKPVLFASMEMSRKELLDRIAASEARVDLTRITRGTFIPEDWDKLAAAKNRMEASHNLFVDDTSSPTMLQIAAKARRVRARRGDLAMIVLDYAELVGERRDETEALRVGQIARGAKTLAKELQCVVVLLSQIKRSVEDRLDKRPGLGDLRGSGELEAAADLVLGLYRDEVYDPETAERGVAEVLVLKARQGKIGRVNLAYLGHHVRFASMARMGEPQ